MKPALAQRTLIRALTTLTPLATLANAFAQPGSPS